MKKNRTGTCVLAYLVAMQVCSMPEVVDSPPMLRLATFALLAYIAFAVMLVWFAARNARASISRPRFWTLANLATFVLLSIAIWTAWRTNCRRLEMAIAAATLIAALAQLHWCNRKNQLRSKTHLACQACAPR